MTKKALGSLALWFAFAVAPALAQMASGPSPSATAGIIPRSHGPMLLRSVVPGGVTSLNWSGYAVAGANFTYANGSWHVPLVECTTTPNAYSVFWVGIDGFTNNTVEQVGTGSDCNGTTPVYYAWYEFYPANLVVITSLQVSPGDKMGATVSYEGGKFTLDMTDYTTGKSFKVTKSVPGALRTSAEWIAEAPSSGGAVLPLADFGRANYGADYNSSDPDSCNATDSSVTDGEIVDFGSKVAEITMVSSKNVVEAVPTALTSDGSSFRINWKSE